LLWVEVAFAGIGVDVVDVIDLVTAIAGVAGDIGAGDCHCVGMMPPYGLD
jgi:hypothetical protein